MTDAWSEMDWQDRAAAGRDLGGRHLGERPARRVAMLCQCDGAARNRERIDSEPATSPPNADGETVCRFCWEVIA